MRISDWSSDVCSSDLPQVVELANEIRLANAAGGILATQGKISADARPAATMQRIELLDGPTLWPELRGLIDPQQRAAILADAATKARQRTLLSWLLALVAGIARSEEHTSELQSLMRISYAVFCFKKKNHQK